MALDFDHILATVRMGRLALKTQAMIDSLAQGIKEFSKPNLVYLKARGGEGFAYFKREWARNAHYSDTTDSRWRGYGSYRVCGWHDHAHSEQKSGIRIRRLRYAW